MKKVIKLSKFSWDGDESSILIGVENIISVEEITLENYSGKKKSVTRILSTGNSINYVLESLDRIFDKITN
jgi:hypothetical protein